MIDLVARLSKARAETLELIALVEDADLNRSLNPEFSPLRWHLGHVAAFEAHWVLVRAGGEPSLSDEYDYLFDPTRNPKSARVDLPPRSELLAYGERVRARVVDVLARSAPDHPDPLLRDAYVGEMVYEHECQHQEILTFLLQMIPPGRKRRPDGWTPAAGGVEPSGKLVAFGGGGHTVGAIGSGFAYDNERPAHVVALGDFALARSPTTELAFASFIHDGGYEHENLWSPEGWRWAREAGVDAPRDWSPTADGWRVRALFEDRPPLPGLPVVGVAQHEAAAFARWAGGRLPTEAEWERAAAGCDASSANVDGMAWGVRPAAAIEGVGDLIGQVWEWTGTTFDAYPGFAAFPYEGYSQDWFDGQHRVLKGGSWATRRQLCRPTFRNWYHPHVREMFAGCRVAASW